MKVSAVLNQKGGSNNPVPVIGLNQPTLDFG